MKSYYASPERETENILIEQSKSLSSNPFLQTIINAMPYPVMILNSKRQIVFSNKELFEQIEAKEFSEFLGKRPGEYLNCIHANDCEGGCGTSAHCKYCGAVNSVLKAQKENRKISEDCRIIANKDSKTDFYNFQVTSSPFEVNGKQFIIYSLRDNSAEKRKELFERIFFHDILNTAGNIRGLAEIIKDTDDIERQAELLKVISGVSMELIDEIIGQRQITEAENGEIQVQKESISSIEILDLVTVQFEKLDNNSPGIYIDEDSDDVDFKCDKTLLSRILKNMLKNAIEASNPDDKVSLGANNLGTSVTFWVNNPGLIPDNIQKQIFQRSFSSKSAGRGYGTYSMKIIGEKYLGGKVYFESTINEGTTFFINFIL